MQRCLSLAEKALGNTHPNPLVGALVVYQNKIIGEGWHQRAGEAHAEVNAINQVENSSLFPKTTLYVNLEPCSHFGKTPPCADLIIKSGIKKVVIASRDPNPQVAGRGIERLKNAGVEVIENVLKEEAEFLNRRFYTYHQKNRPYIILKWAQTEDGFIAPLKKKQNSLFGSLMNW
jgi:diaminohydroxyphosphoribosylaminopyrimidine deaminase/5-amino-6-(5-phosphoribosylamino)uracil reductase